MEVVTVAENEGGGRQIVVGNKRRGLPECEAVANNKDKGGGQNAIAVERGGGGCCQSERV